MPMVEIIVNGRRHSVQCGQGEEARVKGLANYVDRKVAELAVDGAKIGDARTDVAGQPDGRGRTLRRLRQNPGAGSRPQMSAHAAGCGRRRWPIMSAALPP